jgi:dTDP-4-amino-4,6-dideoxygalactose transaminase
MDMEVLMDIATANQLIVIEDTAQAFGAEYRGRKAGTIGDIGCYSFFPSKNLGAYGDGGMLVTNNDEYAEKASMLRVHGSRRKYYNEIVGYNSRLDEVQAAMLRVKLPHIDSWNEARRKAANYYNKLLSGVDGIIHPNEDGYAKHVFHQYTVRILTGKRDLVRERLLKGGVMSMIYYPVPVHRLPVYALLGIQMPRAEQLSREVLSLPIWPQITAETQEFVCHQLINSL